MYASTYLATLALAALVSAKTNLEGCTSSETIKYGGASLVYYVPDTGEICSFLDCGGGRAPPKTTVPGCPQYAGTATYTPEFLSGYPTAGATASASAAETPSGGNTETGSAGSTITSAPALSGQPSGRPTGTGGVPIGGNNVTGTVTLSTTGSPGLPQGTGAANLMASVGKGVFGVAVGVAGLAML